MACHKNDYFNEFGGEAESIRRVYEWINAIPNLKNTDGTINCGVLGKAIHNSISENITLFSPSESKCLNPAIKNCKNRSKTKQIFQNVNEEDPAIELSSKKQRKTNEVSGVSTSNSNSSSPTEDLVQRSIHALQKWTIYKISSCELGLRGELSSVNDRNVTTEDFFAGKILSRLNPFCVKTNEGVFSLIGKLHDSENEIPIEVKEQFNEGFPVKWRKIVCDHWKVSVSGKGVKRLSDSDILPSPKLQKVTCDESVSIKEESESKLPVKRKKNSKCIKETSNKDALETDLKPLNGRFKTKLREKANGIVKKKKDVASEQKSDSGFESVSGQLKKSAKDKKPGGRGKKIHRSTVSKRKRPNVVASADNIISETPCKTKINKKKRKKNESKRNIIIGTDKSDFGLQLNKTGDFFRTFDDDCFGNGIALHSFKEERSIGGCNKSAEKNNSGLSIAGKETPHNKYIAEVFSHSLASNRSGHSQSVHSSPEKRMDVGKRITKFNKGKKTADKSVKRRNIKSKHSGGAEVNAVFKQITQKTNQFTTTPKIIKKIFRKKTYCDDLERDPEDGSELFNSMVLESDSEDDF